MMERIISVRINKNLCTGCGQCVADCVASNLKIEDGKAVCRSEICLECGHCFAICPAGAVEMPAYDTDGCDCLGDMAEFDADRLLLAMKSRRSIRQFKKQKVEAEKIQKILEAGRCAPTAKNAQPNSYIIIDEKMEQMEETARRTFEHFQKKAGALSESLANMQMTDDFFFKGGAQAILIVSESDLDAGLAASYMELMAEALGLGVLYSGFFAGAARLSKEIRQELELGKSDKVVCCLVIGYPDVSYRRTAPRRPLRIKQK